MPEVIREKYLSRKVIILSLTLLILIYVISFTLYQYYEYLSFHTYALDLGVFMQSLYTFCKYDMPLVNNAEGPYDFALAVPVSHFAVHNSPILFIIAPLYCLFPSPLTLFVLQQIALALGVIPIFLLARRHLRNDIIALLLCILYLVNPGLHGISSFDFHPVAFAPLLILWSLYFLDQYRLKEAIPFIILAFMIKEDIPIAFICISLWLIYRRARDILGNKGILDLVKFRNISTLICDRITIFSLALITCSLIWVAVSVFIIIPYFSPVGRYPMLGWYYSTILFNKYVFQYLLSLKVEYTLFQICCLGTLPLLAFDYFIILTFLPWLEIWLSCEKSMTLFGLHYSYMILPLMIVCCIYGIERMLKRGVSLRTIAGVAVPIAVLSILIVNPVPPSLGTNLPIVYYRSIHFLYHYNILNGVTRFLDKLSEKRNISICTSNPIYPHVANNLYTYFGFWGLNKCEYVLIDKRIGGLFFRPGRFETYLVKKRYGTYFDVDEILLFKRGYNGPIRILNITHYLLMETYCNDSLIPLMQIVNTSSVCYTLDLAPRCVKSLENVVVVGNIFIRKSGRYKIFLEKNRNCRVELYIGDEGKICPRGRGVCILVYNISRGYERFYMRFNCTKRNSFISFSIQWETPESMFYGPIPYYLIYPPDLNR